MIDVSRNPKIEKRIELLTDAANGNQLMGFALKAEKFSGEHPFIDEIKSHRFHKHMPYDDIAEAKHRRCGVVQSVKIRIGDRVYYLKHVFRCKDFRNCVNCRKVRQNWAAENFKQQAESMGPLVVINTSADVTPFVRALKGKENYQRMPHENGHLLIVKADDYEKYAHKIDSSFQIAFNVDDESSRRELADVVAETLIELPNGKRSSGALFDLISNPYKSEEKKYLEENETKKEIRINNFIFEPSVERAAEKILDETLPTLQSIIDAFKASGLDLTNSKYAQECQLAMEAHLCEVLTETIGFENFFIDDSYDLVPNPFVFDKIDPEFIDKALSDDGWDDPPF